VRVDVPLSKITVPAPVLCPRVWLTGAATQSKQTPTVDYTKNPVWGKDNKFGFAVHSAAHQQMILALFDSDVGGDDQIGR
jgi:hypothetical protein